jgi:hypothetical protein
VRYLTFCRISIPAITRKGPQILQKAFWNAHPGRDYPPLLVERLHAFVAVCIGHVNRLGALAARSAFRGSVLGSFRFVVGDVTLQLFARLAHSGEGGDICILIGRVILGIIQTAHQVSGLGPGEVAHLCFLVCAVVEVTIATVEPPRKSFHLPFVAFHPARSLLPYGLLLNFCTGASHHEARFGAYIQGKSGINRKIAGVSEAPETTAADGIG